MSTEPLRRILFPTPRKSDDGTSSRSIQRIRPKPELTPVNLESTPTTFRQLVENSPVPLAVAAARAALRAAESTKDGPPIITEMTRAAEEVVKNSDYNAVRPPHLSPRACPSPPRQVSVPARSSSALLPPIPSPSTRPAGALSTFRQMFMRQQQARSWSSTPVPKDDYLQKVDKYTKIEQRKEMKPPTSPVHLPEKRIPPFRQPNFIPTTSENRIQKSVITPGNQPRARAKLDPLSRLFGSSSPLPISNAAETGTIVDDDPIKEDKRTGSSSKSVESSGKQPKKRPRTLARMEPEMVIPEDELNESPAMHTRSAKRSRRPSKANNADDTPGSKPKKKRRMSEVLRLQKALESAAWTNSIDVEKQTEVVVISDCSPDRLRPDVSLDFENKATHEKGTVGKAVTTNPRKRVSGLTKESKLKKAARASGIRQNVIKKERGDPRSKSLGKRTMNAMKRKVASVTQTVNKKRVVQGKDGSVNGSFQDVKQRTKRKEARERKKDRLQRLEAVVAAEKQRVREKAIAGKTAGGPGSAQSADTGMPLKKRLSPEKKEDISPSKLVTNVSLDEGCVDAKPVKLPRKSPKPKRLNAMAKDNSESQKGCEKSRETASTKATSPEKPNPEPEWAEPSSTGGLKESHTRTTQPERQHSDRTSLEQIRPETTDSEATLSETARPREMEYSFRACE